MAMDRPAKPILSSRADDPDAELRIESFVIGLGEVVDRCQDLEAQSDYQGLLETSEKLSNEARELGYEPLADCVDRMAASCQERNPEALYKAVADLTQMAQRVRRGHRTCA